MPAIRPAPFHRMLHRRMAGLAFLAILLLALVPTLGRLAQASAAAGDAAPSWAAMCTARGLESIRLPAATHGIAHDAVPACNGGVLTGARRSLTLFQMCSATAEFGSVASISRLRAGSSVASA